MKLNSTIAAIVLGLGTASVASATNYVYITGSTAARGAIYNALAAGEGFDLNGSGNLVPPTIIVTTAATTAAGSTASYMEFQGTINSVTTIVKCAWSGSEAGISDVSGTASESFLPDPANLPTPITTPGTYALNATPTLVPHTPVDLALADNDVSFSKQPGTTAQEQGPIVIIPFVFVRNHTVALDSANASGTWNNITSDQFKTIATAGTDIGLILGSAPIGKNVYLSGRDSNSGTRVNVFGETGWGIKHSPNQIALSAGAGNPATSTMVVPTGNTAGHYYTAEGQSSGGTLAKSLGDTSAATDPLNGNTTGFYVLSYLGLADNHTATTSPYFAQDLSFNGVAYSYNNVANGAYALWGNEYVLNRANATSGPLQVANAIAADLSTAAYLDGYEVLTSDMNVSRSGPTSSPTY